MTTDEQREYDAKLCEELSDSDPYCGEPHQRVALLIAASTIRRGRCLTQREMLDNLCNAMGEGADSSEMDFIEDYRAQMHKIIGGGMN